MEDSTEECKSKLPTSINKNGHLSSSLFAAKTRMKYDSGVKLSFWSIPEVAETKKIELDSLSKRSAGFVKLSY